MPELLLHLTTQQVLSRCYVGLNVLWMFLVYLIGVLMLFI